MSNISKLKHIDYSYINTYNVGVALIGIVVLYLVSGDSYKILNMLNDNIKNMFLKVNNNEEIIQNKLAASDKIVDDKTNRILEILLLNLGVDINNNIMDDAILETLKKKAELLYELLIKNGKKYVIYIRY